MITASPTEFAAATHGKLAGLDVGTKTIGLASCDAMWSFAGPAETIRRTKFTADLEQLRKFIAAHRRPRRWPAAEHGRKRFAPHAISPRLRP